MSWRETLSRFMDKVAKKRKSEELNKIKYVQLQKEDKKMRAKIIKNIFPRIEKVFYEFAKAIKMDKKWEKRFFINGEKRQPLRFG